MSKLISVKYEKNGGIVYERIPREQLLNSDIEGISHTSKSKFKRKRKAAIKQKERLMRLEMINSKPHEKKTPSVSGKKDLLRAY